MSYCYDYPRPAVTVDIVLFAPAAQHLQVLLIQRRNAPFRGQWALPGGFLDMDEELPAAARRELQEETGLQVDHLLELGAFAAVNRDPRGRTVSIAYLALHTGSLPQPQAGDDAAATAWFVCHDLPPLAFDHALIIDRALTRLQTLAASLAPFCELLTPGLTVAELHALLPVIRNAHSRQPPD